MKIEKSLVGLDPEGPEDKKYTTLLENIFVLIGDQVSFSPTF
jgi:hypothetical protein